MRKLVLFFLAMTVVACGPTDREKALRSSYATLQASAVAFEKWDETYQLKIVDTSESREEAEQRLTEYRNKRNAVVVLVARAYGLIAQALFDPKAIKVDDVAGAVVDALNAIYELRGGK